jgi:hypothetical protein
VERPVKTGISSVNIAFTVVSYSFQRKLTAPFARNRCVEFGGWVDAPGLDLKT